MAARVRTDLARKPGERAQELGEGTEAHGGNLIYLSNWLWQLGRREDALAAIGEAVTAYRQRAAARPRVYRSRLASSLNVMARILASLGRTSEADAARAEAEQLV